MKQTEELALRSLGSIPHGQTLLDGYGEMIFDAVAKFAAERRGLEYYGEEARPSSDG